MKNMNYEKANKELEDILGKLQNLNLSPDDITTLVKRSKELITFCKEKLRETKAQVDEILL